MEKEQGALETMGLKEEEAGENPRKDGIHRKEMKKENRKGKTGGKKYYV